MFVAFSYLSVPFKISERPATSPHYAIRRELTQSAESRSAVCLAFPVIAKSFEAARCHRRPVIMSFRGNKSSVVTGYARRQSKIRIRRVS